MSHDYFDGTPFIPADELKALREQDHEQELKDLVESFEENSKQ